MPGSATLWASLLSGGVVAAVVWGVSTSAPRPPSPPPPATPAPQAPQAPPAPPAAPGPATGPSAVPLPTLRLDDPDPDLRRRAWRALGERGERAELLQHLARASGAEWLAACEGLVAARPGEAEPLLAPLVARLIERPAEAELRRALRALAAAAPAAFVAALPAKPGAALDAFVALAQERVGTLEAGDRAALWARLTAWWLAGSTSPTPGGEESLAILLAGLGARDEAVLGTLVRAFEGGEDRPGDRAALLLARLPGERTRLFVALASPREEHRRRALAGLARAPGFFAAEERSKVLLALEDPSLPVREQAVLTLLGDGTQADTRLRDLSPAQRVRVSALLAGLLRQPARGPRRLAMRGLLGLGPPGPEAVPALALALLSADPELSALAFEAVITLPSDAAPVAPAVVAALEGLDLKDESRALQTWNVLARVGAFAREAVPRVLTLYERSPTQRRVQILNALGRLDPPREAVLPTLRAALADADENVQLAAAHCVAALGERTTPLADLLLARLAALTGPGLAAGLPGARRSPQADQLAPILAAWGARARPVRAGALEQVRRSGGAPRSALLAALGLLAKLEPLWAESVASLLDARDAALRDQVVSTLVAAGRSLGPASAEFAAALEDLPLERIEAALGPLLRDPRESVAAAPALLRIWGAHPASLPLRSAVRTVCALTPGAVAQALPVATPEARGVLRELLAEVSYQAASDAGVAEVVARELARWMDEEEVPAPALAGVVEFLARDATRAEGPRHVPSVRALTAALARLEPARARSLVLLLGAAGSAARPALPDLRALFDRADVAVRVAVLEAVLASDPDPESARRFVLAGLDDENHRVRGAALAIAARPPPRLVALAPDLLRALGQAVRAKGDGGGRPSISSPEAQLRTVLRDADDDVHAAARAQLGDADGEARALLLGAWTVLAFDNHAWLEGLLGLLTDGDPDLRSRALDVLRRLPVDLRSQVTALAAVLDAIPLERAGALLGLFAHLGPAATGSLGVLLRLHHEHPESESVRAALLAVGVHAPQHAVSFLHAATPAERPALLDLFARANLGGLVPAHQAEVLETVVTWLSEPGLSPGARDAALSLLLSLPGEPEGLLPRLLDLLVGADDASASRIAFRLARSPGAGHALAERLQGPETKERGRLLLAMGALQRELTAEEQAAVGGVLEDARPEARDAAAQLLLRSLWARSRETQDQPPALVQALGRVAVEWLRRPDPRRARWGLEVLGWLDAQGPETVPALLALWADGAPEELHDGLPTALRRQARPEDRERIEALARARLASGGPLDAAVAIAVLGAEGVASSVTRERVLPLFRDPDPRVRGAALRWAAWLKSDAADLEPQLLAGLRDPDMGVAQFAAYALTEVVPTSERFFEALASLAGDPQSPLRWLGINHLPRFGKRAVPALVAALAEPALVDNAVGALRVLGAEAAEALPALEALEAQRPRDEHLRQTVAAIRAAARK